MSDRTFEQLQEAAYRQRAQIIDEQGEPSKHAFVVSEREWLILKDQPPFHSVDLNTDRTTMSGMPIQLKVTP